MLYKILNNVQTKWQCLTVACLLALTATSCSDFLDVESHHAASEQQQWQTLEDTRAALMGVYGLMRAAVADNNTQWVCGDLRLGDFSVNGRTDLQAIVDNDLDLNIPLVSAVADWRRFYAVVNAASVFLEKASQVVGRDQAYSEQNLEYDKAQVRALRALAYFYMVRIWGDVPLITDAYDNGSFPQAGRTDAATVLAYVKQELLAVSTILPFSYGSADNKYYRQDDTYWRGKLLNRLSVYAILAHLSALTGNYAEVGTYTSYVLDNYQLIGIGTTTQYVPMADVVSAGGLFNGDNTTYAGNRLVAFNFSDANNESSQGGHLEQWTLATPYVQKSTPDLYVSRDSLSAIFTEVADLRMGIDTATMTYNSNYMDMNASFPMFKKINVVQDGAAVDGDFGIFGSSIIFTRMEDMLLLKAEAQVIQNKPADALLSLNEMRSVRGLSQLSYKKDFGGDPIRLLDGIFAERRRELMGEGWRWYDLVRRQKLRRDNPALLQLIEAGGEYWPVSEAVLKNNPQITQTPYWANRLLTNFIH